MERFEATIVSAGSGGAYVAESAEIIAALGGRGRIPVRATFDGIAYTGSIASMGDGPRRELVTGVNGAKRPETLRRIEKAVAAAR